MMDMARSFGDGPLGHSDAGLERANTLRLNFPRVKNGIDSRDGSLKLLP